MANRFTLRAAVYLLLCKDNQILLQRRFHTGWMDGKYSLIAGHIDGNESVTDAMMREAHEEAGITLHKETLEPATVLHRKSADQEYIDFFFITRHWNGEPRIMEKEKCDELRWFSLDNLPENLLPHIQEAIDNYSKKVAFSESGWK